MGKNNVLDFKTMSNKKLREQFELEDCDEELLDLVSKLVGCSPGSMNKKKDIFKEELLKKIKEQRNGVQPGSGAAPSGIELSDDELDSAAGGIRTQNGPSQNLAKPTNGDGGNQ